MSEETSSAVVARPKQAVAKVKEFWSDTTSEMRKVTWPNRQEVVGTTVVVIVATLIFAVYLWGCDFVFFKAIDFLFNKFGVST